MFSMRGAKVLKRVRKTKNVTIMQRTGRKPQKQVKSIIEALFRIQRGKHFTNIKQKVFLCMVRKAVMSGRNQGFLKQLGKSVFSGSRITYKTSEQCSKDIWSDESNHDLRSYIYSVNI